MLTNKDYKEMVEQKFRKPLKDIMYEICIERGLEKWEGAKELGVPENTFVRWRTDYRYGPLQYSADMAEKSRIKTINKYKQELENINLNRELVFQNEVSLRGFKELAERMLELKKMERTETDDSMSDYYGLHGLMNVAIWESIIKYIEQYESGGLQKQFERELKYVKQ
ncbi:hypothetical protein IEO70_03440 [Bacillus sp. AGMB 02131]|uniref:Uncharacterized protein n=1 Tax=Peribacillus faecalis TaxID=2772559 RepID=A0A927HBH5_9BACI|nr:hypothetical protein [Peribacillus faecalis]MBD3107408.1 hypothetical protein [Peribacillus faecalis]